MSDKKNIWEHLNRLAEGDVIDLSKRKGKKPTDKKPEAHPSSSSKKSKHEALLGDIKNLLRDNPDAAKVLALHDDFESILGALDTMYEESMTWFEGHDDVPGSQEQQKKVEQYFQQVFNSLQAFIKATAGLYKFMPTREH
jgi:hypothetical protein